MELPMRLYRSWLSFFILASLLSVCVFASTRTLAIPSASSGEDDQRRDHDHDEDRRDYHHRHAHRNPAPAIAEVTPSSSAAGSAAAWIRITGSGFISRSVVHWNGKAVSTKYW